MHQNNSGSSSNGKDENKCVSSWRRENKFKRHCVVRIHRIWPLIDMMGE